MIDAAHGITPAHAGKTDAQTFTITTPLDHPRACGENAVKLKAVHKAEGSPPRMRGKPNAKAREVAKFRITPAHAGKTKFARREIAASGDHPRACGENEDPSRVLQTSSGSPPRMRGKPNTDANAAAITRITPAHAGKTRQDCRFVGEKQGSPPRMRGKPASALSDRRILRITPAHAGKTEERADISTGYEDHPRACGENAVPRNFCVCRKGSPPRMRGKPSGITGVTTLKRITPAHAGKTISVQFSPLRPQDHPRACGENNVFRMMGWIILGSPPRMRGKHHFKPPLF